VPALYIIRFSRSSFAKRLLRDRPPARAAGLVEIEAHDLRRWTSDKHHMSTIRLLAGATGMVLKPDRSLQQLRVDRLQQPRKYDSSTRVILLSPQGVLDHPLAFVLPKAPTRGAICGRYEGVDERDGGKFW